MPGNLKDIVKALRQAGSMMVGMPDYDTYVASRRAKHPDEPIMTYEEFFWERQKARYGEGTGRMCRCC